MDQKLNPRAGAALLKRLGNRFDELSNREQRLLRLLSVCIAAAALWQFGIAPAIDALTVTRASLPARQEQAGRILAMAETVAALRERGGSRGQTADSPLESLQSRANLMQWQDRSVIEDRGDGSFRADLNGIPAVDALEWLDSTERLSGLQLKSLTIEKVSTGVVNVRSTWQVSGTEGGKRS